jgi:hypothetical protein
MNIRKLFEKACSEVFVPNRPFQHSSMFEGKDRNLS